MRSVLIVNGSSNGLGYRGRMREDWSEDSPRESSSTRERGYLLGSDGVDGTVVRGTSVG